MSPCPVINIYGSGTAADMRKVEGGDWIDGADLRKAPGLDVSMSTVTVRRRLSAKMESLRGIFKGGGGGERKDSLDLDTYQSNILKKPGDKNGEEKEKGRNVVQKVIIHFERGKLVRNKKTSYSYFSVQPNFVSANSSNSEIVPQLGRTNKRKADSL